ncbi:MAG: hypothetical protein ACE5KH_01270, partial [Candidatus Geothermarchaeales archaeon]
EYAGKYDDSDLGEIIGQSVTGELFAVRDLGNYRGVHTDLFHYTDPEQHESGKVYLQGLWSFGNDHLRHSVQTAEEAYFVVRFYARNVNVVMGPGFGGAYEVTVYLDGEFIPAAYAGKDVRYDEDGRSYIYVEETPRLYSLLNTNVPLDSHEVKVSSSSEEFAFWSFTFGA